MCVRAYVCVHVCLCVLSLSLSFSVCVCLCAGERERIRVGELLQSRAVLQLLLTCRKKYRWLLLCRSSCEQSAGSCGGHQSCVVGLSQSRDSGGWGCCSLWTQVNVGLLKPRQFPHGTLINKTNKQRCGPSGLDKLVTRPQQPRLVYVDWAPANNYLTNSGSWLWDG